MKAKKRFPIPRFAWLLAFFLVVLQFPTGCDDDPPKLDDDDDDNGDVFCTYDSDCLDAGQVCYNQLCQEPIPDCAQPGSCCLDDECGENQFCNDFWTCETRPNLIDDDDDDDDNVTDDDDDTTICEPGKPCLVVEPKILDFGAVQPQTPDTNSFLIKNIGEANMRVLSIQFGNGTHEDYKFWNDATQECNLLTPPAEGETVQAGQQISVSVCLNWQGMGTALGTVDITTDAPTPNAGVNLTMTIKGYSEIEITPTSYNFSDIPVGDDSETSVSICNITDTTESNKILSILDLQFDPSTGTPNAFQIEAPEQITLSPSACITVYVTAACQANGPISGVLSISHNADYSRYEPQQPVQMQFNGNCVSPDIVLPVTNMDFGQITVGNCEYKDLTITNAGGAMLQIEDIGLLNCSDDFQLETYNVIGSGIPAGESRTVTISYCPSTPGSQSCFLQVESNDPDSSLETITLTGQGVVSTVTCLPQNLTFTNVLVGTTSSDQVTVRNSGSGQLIVLETYWNEDVGRPEVFSAPVAEAVDGLPVNSSWDFSVSYTPDSYSTGQIDSAQLIVETNDPTTPQCVINMTGTPVCPDLLLLNNDDTEVHTGDTIDMGSTPLGASNVKTLKLRNVGSYPLAITYIGFGPNSSSDFSYSPSSFGQIGTNGQEVLTITYQPLLYPGTDSGSLIIRTTSCGDDESEIILNLAGIGANAELEIVPTTNSNNPYNFGQVLKNDCADPVLVSLRNKGVVGTLHITGYQATQIYGMPGSWEASNFSASMDDAYLEPYNTTQQEITFELTFCPNGLAAEQSITLQFQTDNSVNGLYRTFHAKGIGTDCPEGMWDLDNDPSRCEYPCTETENRVEKCDGKDNDCNGIVDDGYAVGEACCTRETCPENNGSMCKTGSVCVQDIGGLYFCSCVDNSNCKTGQSCESGRCVDKSCGECGIGEYQCSPYSPFEVICNTMPGGQYSQVQGELCDGKDNDCDGLTDENFNVGQACLGKGECGLGTWQCEDASDLNNNNIICNANFGDGGLSTGYGAPELCDGRDNDCNGVVDDSGYVIHLSDPVQYCGTSGSLSGSAGTSCINMACQGTGDCGWGVWQCAAAAIDPNLQTIRCSSEGAGQAEICDDHDNDCNNEVDEVLFPINGPCGGTTGRICGTMVHKGEACTGIGRCGQGVWECDPRDPRGVICSTESGGSDYVVEQEVCDHIDNDCDGEVDEGFSLGDICTALGECGQGTWECDLSPGDNQFDRRCSTSYGGSEFAGQNEICDGRDNDCDGEIDEDFGTGNPCYGAGECGYGVIECAGTGDATRCSTDPGGSQYGGQTELCDGQDNDCDGQVDESFLVGQTCWSIGQCGSIPGQWECAGLYEKRCSTGPGGSQFAGSVELCDGEDNDCDEDVDEDYGVGLACTGVGLCGEVDGHYECDGLYGRRCSTNIGGTEYAGQDEICNYKDDDCDGSVDEGFDTRNGDIYNCGACGIVCDLDHASPSCVNGECVILSCDNGWYDVNSIPGDGCECQPIGENGSTGESCDHAIQIDPVSLSDAGVGMETFVTGNLAPFNDEDWYTFEAVDATDVVTGTESYTLPVQLGENGVGSVVQADVLCDHFKIVVNFSINPNNQFVFDIYFGGCNATQKTCDRQTQFDFSTWGKWGTASASDPYRVGQCPCTKIIQRREGKNSCENDSKTVYVRVYRAGNSGDTPTCEPYELHISNGK